MLSDCLDDFVITSGLPNANLPALLDEFEADLNHYAQRDWGYSPKVFPWLRKAVRSYVAGKLSRAALEAVRERTLLCYFCHQGSEEELVEDLRGYVRAKPSNDLPAVVARMLSNKLTGLRTAQSLSSLHDVRPQAPASTKISGRTATTSNGTILRLVTAGQLDTETTSDSGRAKPTKDFLPRRVLVLPLAKKEIGELLAEAASFMEPGAPAS